MGFYRELQPRRRRHGVNQPYVSARRSRQSRSGKYTISRDELDSYLIPKRPVTITAENLHHTGRGVAYTKPTFAYLFQHLNP